MPTTLSLPPCLTAAVESIPSASPRGAPALGCIVLTMYADGTRHFSLGHIPNPEAAYAQLAMAQIDLIKLMIKPPEPMVQPAPAGLVIPRNGD